MTSTQFLNIDLDLESEDDLTIIVDEFGDNVIVLSNEKNFGLHKLSFELAGEIGNSEYLLTQYFSLICSLSSKAREIWDRCLKREFDLGFECGHGPIDIQEKISNSLIIELSELNVSITVTVYSVPVVENQII